MLIKEGNTWKVLNEDSLTIQSVVISKSIAKTEKEAAKIAEEVANVYSSKETSTSWRFRQQPPSKFVRGSFVTKKLKKGVSVVLGKLKSLTKIKRGKK